MVRHATDLEDDYEDIAASGDLTLVPRLDEALDAFLDSGNFYGCDLIATVTAGIRGVAALPSLLRASARDLRDDQDSPHGVLVGLLEADRAASRPAVLEFAASAAPDLRRVGLWALGFVVEAEGTSTCEPGTTTAAAHPV